MIHSFLPVRTKRGDGTVQQVPLWHGAVPDVLPLLPHVCCSSGGAPGSAGEHSRLCTRAKDKGMQRLSFPKCMLLSRGLRQELFSRLSLQPLYISRSNTVPPFLFCPRRTIDWKSLNTWCCGLVLDFIFPMSSLSMEVMVPYCFSFF